MEIDFMEAIDGVEKTVDIDGKRRTIKIPPGVTSGTRINFTDFLLTISVRAHELFERDGADIYMTLEIPFSLATLGGHVDVPTIKKPVKVKIRSGTQSGTMLRLRGEGAPVLNSSKRGDHYVKITIETPSKLTRSQKKLIEQLQQEGL
jgi:DnaJ-class molecular chaperone